MAKMPGRGLTGGTLPMGRMKAGLTWCSPTQPVGGSLPALWLVGDDVAGADGDAVGAWNDRSGNNNHFAQADPAKKPVLKTGANGINGHKVIRGNGTSSILTAANFSTTTQGSVFVVYRLSSPLAAAQQQIISSADEGTTNYYCRIAGCLASGTPILQVDQKSNDTVDDLRGTTNLVADVAILLGVVSDGASYSVRYHGSVETMTIITGANSGDWFGDTANRDNVSLFASKRNTESRWMKGDIAELILYPVGLSAADAARVEQYLASKYNLWYSPVRTLQVQRTDADTYLVKNRVSGEAATPVQWKMTKQTAIPAGWAAASGVWNIRDLTVKGAADIILGNKSAAWEYGYNLGADADVEGDYGWVGSIHQAESLQSLTFTLDGRDVSGMANGETRFGGAAVVLTQAINTIYPKDKVSLAGTTTLTHTWTATALDVQHAHTFAPGYQLSASYSAMAPTTSAGAPAGIDTYQVGSNPAAARVNDGNAKNKPTETDTVIFYHSAAHPYQLTLFLPDGGPDSSGLWTYSGDWKAWFLDGVDADNGKAYVNWIDGDFADRVTPPASSSHRTRYTVSKR